MVKNWPHFASSASPVYRPTAEYTADKTLRERVTNWLANCYSRKSSGNSELVSEEEAERRAKICESCPRNQEAGNDCPPCVASNQRTAFLIREGKETPTKVKSCDIVGQDNSVAVWLSPKMLYSASKYKDQLPSFCWLHDLNF